MGGLRRCLVRNRGHGTGNNPEGIGRRNIGYRQNRRAAARGLDTDGAGAAALLALLVHTADTNLLARGGCELRQQVEDWVSGVLAETPYPSKETLVRMDEAFIRDHLSPGGSADLLSVCWMLHFLKGEQP